MSETIGKRLKLAREEKGISLEEVSLNTRIRVPILRALEDDDVSNLSSQAQARGFLRIYADFLGMHLTDLQPKELENVQNDKETSQNPDENITHEVSKTTKPLDPDVPAPLENQNPDDDQDHAIIYSSEPLVDQQPSGSKAIFKEIGEQLKQRRELLSLSLSNIEEHIRIKHPSLEALELGDIDSLPSSVQARGMLQNYARFLNLNIDAVMLRFAEGLQERRLEKINIGEIKRRKPQKVSSVTLSLKKFFTLDLLFGSIMILGILGFLIWGTTRITATDRNYQAEPTIPAVAEILTANGTPTEMATESIDTDRTSSPETDTITEPTALFTPLPIKAPIQIIIIANQSAWVRVISDGKQVFEGRVQPGNVYTFTGDDQIEIISGNAAALQIFFNQEDLGSLGLIGQVINLIFTENGLITPTATPTQTPTNTPQTTNTPTLETPMNPTPP